MNIPGVLSVGARYCTQQGKCETVGAQLGAIPLKDGGSAPAEIGCRINPEFEACLANRLPVQLLARTPAGSVIARINDRNYAITGQEWALEKSDASAIGGPIMIEVAGELSPLHYELRGMTKASRLQRAKAIEVKRMRAIAGILGAKGRRCDQLMSVEKTSEGGEYTAKCLVKGKEKIYREYASGIE